MPALTGTTTIEWCQCRYPSRSWDELFKMITTICYAGLGGLRGRTVFSTWERFVSLGILDWGSKADCGRQLLSWSCGNEVQVEEDESADTKCGGSARSVSACEETETLEEIKQIQDMEQKTWVSLLEGLSTKRERESYRGTRRGSCWRNKCRIYDRFVSQDPAEDAKRERRFFSIQAKSHQILF